MNNQLPLIESKSLIDLSFREFLKFDGTVPQNRDEADKALREYSVCSTNLIKLKEMSRILVNDIESKEICLAEEVRGTMEKIKANIEKYYEALLESSPGQFENKGDGKFELTIELEHGKIVVTEVTQRNYKIKPLKN